MAVQIQLRRATASAWTAANTVLAEGEIGFESDTKYIKFGDGVTAWTSLAYSTVVGAVTTSTIVDSAVTTPKIADANVTSAKLATSISLTGVPLAPTASPGTDTTQLATTAFVAAASAVVAVTADAAIQEGFIAAKGDLIAGAANDTPAILTVGTDGYFLKADSVEATGLAWGALDLSTKADLASPTLTGVPAAPTATVGTSTTQLATTAFVATEVAALVDASPAALNTLNELALALGSDAAFSTTMTNSLAAKAPLANPTFTGTVTLPSGTVTSGMILDGTILDADINASAAIALEKLADVAIDTKTADYVLVLTDKNKVIEMNITTTANTVTVPTNATAAFPVGSQITIWQYGTGKTQIIPVSGTVTINKTPGDYLRARYSSATLIKRGTNEWFLIGDLSAS